VVKLEGGEYPDHLFYDVENQIWYEPLADGTVRAGFTAWAVSMMGDVLVFTPKRLGRNFEKGRSFAVVEGGKWVGSARSAFDGIVVAHNEVLIRKPELLRDAFGEGWMLMVRPSHTDWRKGLVTGGEIAPAFEAWFASEAYRDRTG
jgi:glycine cleavage system H protein